MHRRTLFQYSLVSAAVFCHYGNARGLRNGQTQSLTGENHDHHAQGTSRRTFEIY